VESNADADAMHVMRLISARLDSTAPGPVGEPDGAGGLYGMGGSIGFRT
jgi:hypothetical protein